MKIDKPCDPLRSRNRPLYSESIVHCSRGFTVLVLWTYFLMVSDYSVIGPEQWRLQFGHHQLKPLSLMLKNGPLLKQRGTNDFRIINCFVYFCHLVKIINRFPSLFCISQNTLINNVLRH